MKKIHFFSKRSDSKLCLESDFDNLISWAFRSNGTPVVCSGLSNCTGKRLPWFSVAPGLSPAEGTLRTPVLCFGWPMGRGAALGANGFNFIPFQQGRGLKGEKWATG